jgi:outer membrane protein, heavy metal efflux system
MKRKILQTLAIKGFFVLLAGMVLAQNPMPDVLTLDAASERLVQKNLSLEAARLEVSRAEQARVYSRLRPRPTLDVSVENLKIAGNTPFGNLYETGAVISQPIELGKQRNSRAEVAEKGVSLAEARLSGVLRQRLIEMRTAFFEVLLAQERLKSDDENSKNFDELLRYTEVRLKEGDIAPAELMKLRLEKIKYQSAQINSRLNLRQAKIRLLQVLGEVDFAKIDSLELREPFEFKDFNINLVSLKDTALQNRPDIKIAEAEFLRAQSVLKLETNRGKGEVVPYAGYRRVGVDNTVLVGVSVPLPFGNRNQLEIAQADADRKIAETVLQQNKNKTLAEVETVFLSFETAREQVKAYQIGILQQAEELQNITFLSYREGATELINLLEAQRTRTDLRSNYYQALLQYYTSLFQLELVTGIDLRS